MTRYRIEHKTAYKYAFPVAVSHHSARLEPANNSVQSLSRFSMSITPEPADLSRRIDYFGNVMHLFSIQDSHSALSVTTSSLVNVHELPISELSKSPDCGQVREHFGQTVTHETVRAQQFCYESPLIVNHPEIAAYAANFLKPNAPYLQAAIALMRDIHSTFEFDATATDTSTPILDFYHMRRGVCQDFAQLMIACLRSVGLPACYVSGYILTFPPKGQARLRGADASHAWVSIYVPGIGWVDLDPTNNQLCGEQHITVARGRDFSDVSLVQGAVTGGGAHTVDIAVTVTPVN